MSRTPATTPGTTPAASTAVVNDRRARIEAVLASKGVVPNWDAPLVTEIRHSGTQTGRLCGGDVDPTLEYVRVSAHQTETISRYMQRGYALVDPNKDVYIDNCRGPDDVMMAARKEVVESARQARTQRRKQRRGQSRTEDGATYTSSEGRFVRPG